MPLIAAHNIKPSEATVVDYNGYDCCLTSEIEEVTASIDDASARMMYEVLLGLQGPVIEMMLRGFRVDPVERERALKRVVDKKRDLERIMARLISGITGNPYNEKFPNSGKQLREFFYGGLGIKPITKRDRKTGLFTQPMDRPTLERLGDQNFYAEPITNMVLLHRDLTGLLEDLETMLDGDGKWRTSYNLTGAETWRFSSSKSILGSGGNAQNITEENRIIFIPDPGWKLAGIDAAQSEARDVGWFCGLWLGAWSYLDAIERGDIHTTVSRMCWPSLKWSGDTYEADKGPNRRIADRKFYRHLTYRDISKKSGHGSNYLERPQTLARAGKIPLAMAKEFQIKYFDAFPEIRRMHLWISEKIQRDRYLVNCFGAKRDFFDRPEADETLRSAVAHMFQSATALRVNLGGWRLWKKLGTRIQILSQLHDAWYFQYRPEEEDEILPQALELMKVSLWHQGREFFVPGEASVGWNWAHKYKLDDEGNLIEWNPRGLNKWSPK